MSIVIELPTTLRPFASGEAQVALNDHASFNEALGSLIARHPRLKSRLVTGSGTVYDFVSVFVNDRRVGPDEFPEITLDDGDVVTLVPAMAGG
ncbi:MoaD/ThiS family protein [Paracoccus onubensis]|uniref:MoaD/ThiS family protein n=1 Tax=Paracoccus onubensis TaxID=1675788 RepID=UPI002730EEE2|nr:MoaD/ThiS family protein [Paracoccus onubensis]MDP0926806.1 MoaD/ThiS family protein [Paracoccus onubensis]